MPPERTPIADDHDALVELLPWDGIGRAAFAVVKRTYRITDRGLVLAKPAPLREDLRTPPTDGTWPTGSDFWPSRDEVQVAVRGHAYAAGGKATPERRVAVRFGKVEVTADVLGPRAVEWRGGRPRIGAPEPFLEVPLDAAHAYGGIDEGVEVEVDDSPDGILRRLLDHPGTYPRNPFGRGYRVALRPGDETWLPQVEDPADRLTAERLASGDPARWYAQPLPRTFDWVPAAAFPRSFLLGFRPWFAVPDGVELPEVRRGELPTDWRARAGHIAAGQAPDARFHREASPGMSFTRLAAGCPIELDGMHPERPRLAFTLPEPPRLVIGCEGDREVVDAKLTMVLLRPGDETVELTWAGRRETLPRAFVRGVHGVIPLTVEIDGRARVSHETPEPILARVRAAAEPTTTPPPPAAHPLGTLRAAALAPEMVRHGVDLLSGHLAWRSVDWRLAGPVSLAFGRTHGGPRTDGALGPTAGHDLDLALEVADDRLVLRRADGRRVPLLRRDGGERPIYVGPPDEPLIGLRAGPRSFTVRSPSGRRWSFALTVDGRPAALVAIDDDGGQVALRRDRLGRLQRVVLPTGASFRVEHDGARLRRILGPRVDGPRRLGRRCVRLRRGRSPGPRAERRRPRGALRPSRGAHCAATRRRRPRAARHLRRR